LAAHEVWIAATREGYAISSDPAGVREAARSVTWIKAARLIARAFSVGQWRGRPAGAE
jgi:hypothetical protein